MSVPVPLRDQGELEVNTKARAMAAYTLKITANEKELPGLAQSRQQGQQLPPIAPYGRILQ